MRYLLACLLLLTAVAAWAEDAFHEDFSGVTGWEMQRSWLALAARDPHLTATAGIATFAIAEPAKGMKWLRVLEEPVDLDVAPWLVIRYRVSNYAAGVVDYLLYLDDGKQGEGVPLIKGDRIRADGQWHTQAFDLVAEHVTSPVSGLALQCFATAAGNARFDVDYVSLTDLPPADAEGYEAAREPQQVWPVELDAADWQVQPSWVGNFSAASRCEGAGAGLVFKVPESSRGAKWSRTLPAPLTGATWVAMRYRARNLQSWGDYALYLTSGGGGEATQEEYAIRQPELVADGEWHVALGQVTISTVRILAVQVQAGRDDASLEIAELRFLDAKPIITLAETFDGTPGWPANMEGWRPVSLPAGNMAGEDLSRRLGARGWIATGKLTAAGVPFTVRDGAGAVNMTPVRETGEVAVPLTGKAAEAYLLLAAQFPANDEPSYAQSSGLVTHVHRFVARITYADGATEEQFPLAMNSGRHAVSRGLHTYALALEPGKTLKSLALVDRMSRGSFGLVALTLSDRPSPATATTRLRPATPLPAEKPVAARKAGLSRVGDRLIADSWSLSLALDLKPGLRLTSLANNSGVGLQATAQPGPLFRVLGPAFEVTSEQFTVEKVGEEKLAAGTAMRLDLQCAAVTPALKATVWVDVADPREIGLRAKLDLGGHDPATIRFIFPEVREVRFSDRPADTWVWCPRRGDVITAAPLDLREPYAGAGNPFQIIGAFDPCVGTGLYLLTQDMDAVSRFYQVQKTDAGARLGVEYTPLYEPDLPRTVLGCNQGDWHAQLARYREWAATWYQAAAPRKRWFREVFSFRQHFLHFALPTPSGMFDRDSRTFRLSEVMAADAAAFGGLDYLHLFDWGWDPVHGRCGDYEPWDYLGGADHFRKAVAGVQDAGTPVGLYLEGILVDRESNLGKAHGADWQMLDAAGKPYQYFAPSYHICGHVPAWQQYLSDTYRRVQQQTGARGFYIDEYGFSSTTYWCYNPAHGHPVPSTPVRGERAMLQHVRTNLGPEAAVYTEESPTDVNSQYQDGSFTYNISSVPDDWSPTHVNLYRFAYPDFKTIEIICCDQPLGSNVEAVKRILFNGEAIWIEGIRDKWFTPETRAQIALNRRVMRENRNCFISDHVQALVPTLVEGIYANQFAERPDLLGKTCWTVYNTLYRTVRTEVLAVDHAPGSQYLDEMTGDPLKPRIVGQKAHLTLTLSPRDVVVVSRGLFVK